MFVLNENFFPTLAKKRNIHNLSVSVNPATNITTKMPPPPVAPRTSLTPPTGTSQKKIPPPVTPRSSQLSLVLLNADRPQTSKATSSKPVVQSKSSFKPMSTLTSFGPTEAGASSADSFSMKFIFAEKYKNKNYLLCSELKTQKKLFSL